MVAQRGPRPASEQLCPLRPQAAQPLGALVPRAAPRPPGPTGQVLALALGQVTNLWSPRLLGVSASVPRLSSHVGTGSPTEGGVSAPAHPCYFILGHPFSEARSLCPHSHVPSPWSPPRALSSPERPEGAPGGRQEGTSLLPVRLESFPGFPWAGRAPQAPTHHTHATPSGQLPGPLWFTRSQVERGVLPRLQSEPRTQKGWP